MSPRVLARLARTAAPLCAVTALTSPAFADDAACIAASEQAIPLRQQGKLHGALQQLAVCAAAACPGEVRAECATQIESIRGAMPTLILEAKDGAGNDLAAVRVTMDGAPLATTLDGSPLAIDPGEHTFRFETAGQPSVEKKLVLRHGEKDRRERVVIGSAPAIAPPPPPPQPQSSWSTPRTLAIVSGGIGLVGVGLGVAFSAYASSSQTREKADCSSSGCLNYAQAVEDYDTAKKNALGATVAFVAGGALLATGIVVWFAAPRHKGAGSGPRATAPGEPRRPALSASARGVSVTPALVGTGGGLVLRGVL